MKTTHPTSEFLVLSRGQWDPELPPERIQTAIDDFYVWLGRLVEEGRMKPGQRLSPVGKIVARNRVTDGPFGEAKEVVGGYWYIVAENVEQAAAIAAENPCLQCGLFYEVRAIELQQASAFVVGTETPSRS